MFYVTFDRVAGIASRKCLICCFLTLVLPLVVGCESADGPERVAVKGIITVDGQNLPSGVIRFIPTASTQGPATVATIQDGTYELSNSDGPILGTHRVEIEATNYLGFAIDDEAAFAATMQKRKPLPKNPVPAVYNRQSILSANVIADGPREFSFELSSKGSQSQKR